MPKRKKIDVELLKEKILETALEVFAERGYSQTNIKDIVKKLGVTRTPIYYHFENKYEIYKQVVEKYLNQKTEIFKNILTDDQEFFTKIKNDLSVCTKMGISEEILFGEIYSNPELEKIRELRIKAFETVYAMKIEAVENAKRNNELIDNFEPKDLVDFIYLSHFGLIGLKQCKLHDFSQKSVENILEIVLEQTKRKYSKK